MASIYEIEKQLELVNLQVDSILKQTRVLCEILGIDPTPMPNNESVVNNETIEELTDPDA